MKCPDAETMAAFVAGSLSVTERTTVANHAASCAPCHAVVEALIHASASAIDASTRANADTLAPDKLGAGGVPTIRGAARVGRYVIGERLGSGGMGVVHAAIDTKLHRRVAVKLLRPDPGGHIASGGSVRLLREAQAMARLSHPNVVTVFDVGTHGGQMFVAMELIDGGSLSAWLRRAPRGTEDVLGRMIEAGRGLAAAHAAGFVHRDVKPDNILVGLDGRAQVTDFGLVQLGEAPSVTGAATGADVLDNPATLTAAGALIGTPMYMAPEQLSRGASDARTDQWSYCATLYEALAGVRPFVVDDLAARRAAIVDGRLAAAAAGRRVPGWVRAIVTRGLRADPEARWPSMDAVVTALTRGRHRRRVALLSMAVITVAGLAIGMLLRRPGEPTVPPRVAEPAKPPASYPGWADTRPGCDCPFSGCQDGCVSVCRASGYTMGAPLSGISLPGRQEALLGVSADGDTVLYLAGQRCAIDHLMLARRSGSTFLSVDLTDQLDLRRMAIDEGCCTLSADARSLVMSTADRSGFVRVGLEGDRLLATEGAELAGLLPDPVAGRIVRFPILAPDELTLYFQVTEPDRGPGDESPRNGVYAAARSDLQARFAPARRLTGLTQRYESVAGVSADGLSLFMTREYGTFVLVRDSTAEYFRGLTSYLSPAPLPGWRAKPLADCARIVTTSTPPLAGCAGEDIVYLEALPR